MVTCLTLALEGGKGGELDAEGGSGGGGTEIKSHRRGEGPKVVSHSRVGP